MTLAFLGFFFPLVFDRSPTPFFMHPVVPTVWTKDRIMVLEMVAVCCTGRHFENAACVVHHHLKNTPQVVVPAGCSNTSAYPQKRWPYWQTSSGCDGTHAGLFAFM